jgi:predicted nucleotidyltransferase
MTTAQAGTASADPRLQADIEEVKRIVLEGLGTHRARVWLFGSRAQGSRSKASDIDVAILPLEPLAAGTLARIEESLDNSLVLYAVDLVDLSTAEPALRERVERDGIPWTS